jgi:predicted O-methyltransferase YrrM
MPITPDEYAELHSSPLPPLLQELLHYTLKNHPKQHMVSGPVQGQFLRMISLMLQPKYVLEIGTFTGFSALCLAEGLTHDGRLYTLEVREEDAILAQSFFNRSPKVHQIHLGLGEAAHIIPTLPYAWDLVFIDADKTGYGNYLDLVLQQVRPGGIILADNVLFHGEVLEEEIKGKNAKAIAAFNDKVRQTPGIDYTLLTIRDGLMMIRKNSK